MNIGHDLIKQTNLNNMAKKKARKLANRTPEVMEEHELIIAEYFANGFNGQLAVNKYREHLDAHVAANVWQGIKNSPHNKGFIDEYQSRLSALVDVKAENVTRELINFGFNDVTQYIGLDEEGIKLLPPEARRCIQDVTTTHHTDKHGNITGTTIKIKTVPKLDSLRELAKGIGYYSLDNDQKANKVNILQVLQKSNPETLNALLKTITEQEEQ